jgi:hypothetical protein
MSGAWIPAWSMLLRTSSAVPSMRGRMLAFSAAVRARFFSP